MSNGQIRESSKLISCEIDWRLFIEKLIDEKLVLLIERNLKLAFQSVCPKDILNEIIRIASQQKRKNLRLQYELIRVATALEQSGLQSIFFKGPILSQQAYHLDNIRSYNDLDILLTDKDYHKPNSYLKDLGYINIPNPTLSRERIERVEKGIGEYILIQCKSQICLDVHNHLLGKGQTIIKADFADAWTRSKPIMLGGTTLSTLCDDDLLLYLCTAALKDNWKTLRSICEIHELIQNSTEINWDTVWQRAREKRIDRILGIGCSVAQAMYGTQLPDEMREAFREDDQVEKTSGIIYKYMISKLNSEIPNRHRLNPFYLKWSSLKYWSSRIYYCKGMLTRPLKLLFFVNQHDVNFVSLPQKLSFLYYLVRPLRLLRDYRIDLLRLLLG